jgi:hypothetical protein
MAPLLASAFDQTKYLRAEDIKQPTKFRIKETTEEVLNNRKTGKPENKLVVYFTTTKKGLVLSAKTNIRTLQGAFGDDTAGWKEKVVVLFTTPTELGPGVRVRIPPPKQAPAAPQQPVTPDNGAAAAAPPATPAATPAASGNGADAAVVAAAPLAAPAAPPSGSVVTMTRGAVSPAAPAAVDPDLVDDPTADDDDMGDEIPF